MSSFTIDSLKRIEPRAEVFSLVLDHDGPVLPSQPGGWVAQVSDGKRIYSVSQLDGETGWVIDGEFLADGLPIFFNGEGARYTLLHKVADETVVAALDAQVAA